jgi:hypothetical protein
MYIYKAEGLKYRTRKYPIQLKLMLQYGDGLYVVVIALVLFGLFFDLEDGRNMFLWNVVWPWRDYTAWCHSRHLSNCRYESIKLYGRILVPCTRTHLCATWPRQMMFTQDQTQFRAKNYSWQSNDKVWFLSISLQRSSEITRTSNL